MSERSARHRWPKRAVRAVAWSTAGAAFLTGLGALGAAPQPSGAAAVTPVRQKVIIRRIVKRVVIVDPVAAPVTVPASSPTSTRAGAVRAPAPAPTTSTGGSHG